MATATDYARLEERILARDQVGASMVLYGLMKDKRPVGERITRWLTLVQRGDVLPAYRVFLGLMEDAPNRRQVLAHLAFAGLIDVQDRMLHNRSYTTGHKSFRARATIELGEALGWDAAQHVVYAGVPDLAVGPRWYSTYEMG